MEYAEQYRRRSNSAGPVLSRDNSRSHPIEVKRDPLSKSAHVPRSVVKRFSYVQVNSSRPDDDIGASVRSIPSAMRYSTLDASLHAQYDEERKRKNRRSINWDSIQIREYERALGDNPSCSSGPPVR
jgi:hypothetical protein